MRRAGHVSGEARILGCEREESRHHSTQSRFWEERRHLEAGRTILVNWAIVSMHWCFGREEREQIEVDERILEKEGGGRAHGVLCIRFLEDISRMLCDEEKRGRWE
jgi:hypothetical protein